MLATGLSRNRVSWFFPIAKAPRCLITINEGDGMGGIAVDPKEIEGRVVEAIKTCYDPEIPVDIYELGLIYGVEVDPSGSVEVTMTLTSPNCPSAVELPGQVEAKGTVRAGRDGRPGRGRLRPTLGALADERGRSALSWGCCNSHDKPRRCDEGAFRGSGGSPAFCGRRGRGLHRLQHVRGLLPGGLHRARPPNTDPRSRILISVREDECIGCFVCAKVCEELAVNAIRLVPAAEAVSGPEPPARPPQRPPLVPG